MNKRILTAIIVILVLGTVIAAVLILRGRGIKIPFLSAPVAEEETTGGLGSASFEKANNPIKGNLPGNPFEGETNPFKGGINPIEKSYNNPLK